ncbi:MAG: hypothetical protein V9G15_00075 [Dermatophilaceae bacterium]|nr:hypothetical protein [Actinomycetales bacterium]
MDSMPDAGVCRVAGYRPGRELADSIPDAGVCRVAGYRPGRELADSMPDAGVCRVAGYRPGVTSPIRCRMLGYAGLLGIDPG